jgi:hypothetical protein
MWIICFDVSLMFLSLISVVCLAHFLSICLVFSVGFEEAKCSNGGLKCLVRISILE